MKVISCYIFTSEGQDGKKKRVRTFDLTQIAWKKLTIESQDEKKKKKKKKELLN